MCDLSICKIRQESDITAGIEHYMHYFAHESCYIDENVSIGEGSKIWHFCHIMPHTVIGKHCSFGQNCVVGPNVKIGNNVKVQNNISIYNGVECEDDVFLGPSMVFTNVINPRSYINRKHEFKKTLIKKGASIGANATVICGITIGAYAMIGAGAVITKDVKPFALMVGVPAKQIGWVGIFGERLDFNQQGMAKDQTGAIYKLEYYIKQSHVNYSQNTSQPFFDLQAQYYALQAEIEEKIDAVLVSASFIMGPEVQELENALENYTGAKHCITCANGTDALQIALMAIGIQPEDEVITTPFTFVSTAETIVLLGAEPVFVDIEAKSFLIDATLIEENITAKTKAIIPVSLYGQMADMDVINKIAKQYSEKYGHKIYVIEDAAQSFGAEYKGQKSCNASDIATASFFPTKPLGCYGGGGAIFTSDSAIAQKLREIRVHGQSKRYCHTRVGVNSRLDTLQAAILQVKLKYLDQEITVRRHNAEQYFEQYKNSDIITPIELPNCKHIYGQYTMRVENRDQFREKLKAEGIPTAVHYPIPLHQQPAFIDKNAHCPHPEKASQEVVSLPMCLYPGDLCHSREGGNLKFK